MVLGVSDFVKIPEQAKYIIMIALVMGATITIPVLNISIGDILFSPFSFALSFMGIPVSFKEFAILIMLIGLIMFANSMRR